MKKGALFMVVAVVMVVTVILVVGQVNVVAQEGTARIIRIWRLSSEGQKVVIEPETTYISPGTVIVWWNKGKQEARVRFLEGERCQVRSSSPTGFSLESENCFQTSYMVPGSISSLKFDKEGTYEFEIEFKGMGTKKGKIVVSEVK